MKGLILSLLWISSVSMVTSEESNKVSGFQPMIQQDVVVTKRRKIVKKIKQNETISEPVNSGIPYFGHHQQNQLMMRPHPHHQMSPLRRLVQGVFQRPVQGPPGMIQQQGPPLQMSGSVNSGQWVKGPSIHQGGQYQPLQNSIQGQQYPQQYQPTTRWQMNNKQNFVPLPQEGQQNLQGSHNGPQNDTTPVPLYYPPTPSFLQKLRKTYVTTFHNLFGHRQHNRPVPIIQNQQKYHDNVVNQTGRPGNVPQQNNYQPMNMMHQQWQQPPQQPPPQPQQSQQETNFQIIPSPPLDQIHSRRRRVKVKRPMQGRPRMDDEEVKEEVIVKERKRRNSNYVRMPGLFGMDEGKAFYVEKDPSTGNLTFNTSSIQTISSYSRTSTNGLKRNSTYNSKFKQKRPTFYKFNKGSSTMAPPKLPSFYNKEKEVSTSSKVYFDPNVGIITTGGVIEVKKNGTLTEENRVGDNVASSDNSVVSSVSVSVSSSTSSENSSLEKKRRNKKPIFNSSENKQTFLSTSRRPIIFRTTTSTTSTEKPTTTVTTTTEPSTTITTTTTTENPTTSTTTEQVAITKDPYLPVELRDQPVNNSGENKFNIFLDKVEEATELTTSSTTILTSTTTTTTEEPKSSTTTATTKLPSTSSSSEEEDLTDYYYDNNHFYNQFLHPSLGVPPGLSEENKNSTTTSTTTTSTSQKPLTNYLYRPMVPPPPINNFFGRFRPGMGGPPIVPPFVRERITTTTTTEKPTTTTTTTEEPTSSTVREPSSTTVREEEPSSTTTTTTTEKVTTTEEPTSTTKELTSTTTSKPTPQKQPDYIYEYVSEEEMILPSSQPSSLSPNIISSTTTTKPLIEYEYEYVDEVVNVTTIKPEDKPADNEIVKSVPLKEVELVDNSVKQPSGVMMPPPLVQSSYQQGPPKNNHYQGPPLMGNYRPGPPPAIISHQHLQGPQGPHQGIFSNVQRPLNFLQNLFNNQNSVSQQIQNFIRPNLHRNPVIPVDTAFRRHGNGSQEAFINEPIIQQQKMTTTGRLTTVVTEKLTTTTTSSTKPSLISDSSEEIVYVTQDELEKLKESGKLGEYEVEEEEIKDKIEKRVDNVSYEYYDDDKEGSSSISPSTTTTTTEAIMMMTTSEPNTHYKQSVIPLFVPLLNTQNIIANTIRPAGYYPDDNNQPIHSSFPKIEYDFQPIQQEQGLKRGSFQTIKSRMENDYDDLVTADKIRNDDFYVKDVVVRGRFGTEGQNG